MAPLHIDPRIRDMVCTYLVLLDGLTNVMMSVAASPPTDTTVVAALAMSQGLDGSAEEAISQRWCAAAG